MRSRSATARRSTRSRSRRRTSSTAPAPRRSSGRPASPAPSGRPRPTRASGSSGTTGRSPSCAASASTTGCAASRSPTTTWSTSTSRSGATSGRSGCGSSPRRFVGPADVLRAWGHPVAVRGDVTLDGRRANLRAVEIPAGQFVELRALSPDGCSRRPRGCGSNPGPVSSGSRPRSVTTRRRTSATGQDRRRARPSAADDCAAARPRARPGAPGHRPGLVDLRPRARDVIRPRVRAGAADRDRACARPVAPRPGRHARIAGVHGDAVRPDPPGPLPRRAGDDGTEDLGWPQDPAGLGPRALARRRRGAGRGVRGAGRAGRRLDPRRRAGAPLALPRPDRGRPDGELGALQRLQVGGRVGDLGPEVVQQQRPLGVARWCGDPRHCRPR